MFHELKRGETLWGLATRYGVDVDELIEVNGIQDPRDMRVGRMIFIPEVDTMAPATHSTTPAAEPVAPKQPIQASSGRLRWPVDEGVLYAGFGVRHGVRHDGIDLGAPEGTPVLAAADAEVMFVGYDRAFGNLVILRHRDDLVTVYAHNRDTVVRVGQRVRAGDKIAHVGQSGRSEGPHLHFEVREGTTPVDPLRHLPED